MQLFALGALVLVLTLFAFLALLIIRKRDGDEFHQTALYIYCRTGAIPLGFQPATMQGAFAVRPESKIANRFRGL